MQETRSLPPVKQPLNTSRVMFAGLIEEGLTVQENEIITPLGLSVASPEALLLDS